LLVERIFMDSTYITPLIDSTKNVFETMLQLSVEVGQPAVKESGQPSHDVSGIIGLSGDLEGAMALSFSTETGERLISLFVGEHIDHSNEDFADAVGELINMISGGAKANFAGKNVNIACPTVIIGQDHKVFSRKDVTCISIPCNCDCGDFTVEFSLRNGPSDETTCTSTATTATNV
jgi:chemotaxis protein CheX